MVSLFTIALALNISGCSSSGSSDEESAGGDETFAEESSGDFEDGEEVADGDEGAEEGSEEVAEGEEGLEDGEEASEEVADGEELESEELDGELADAEGSEDGALDEGGLDEGGLDEGGTDVAATDDDELSLDDEEGLPDDVAGTDVPADTAAPIEEPATPPTDAPVFAEESTPPATDPIVEEPVAPRAFLPLLKVKSAAFDSGGTNLNRVYVGRPGDTVKSVAEKLYGDSGRQKDLKNWNSFLSRGVKVGDKIYYQSPTNPTDTTMLTYYEDVSIPAQNYVSRDGDNIREISKTLLGHNDSWKEIWSTNPDVESKGDIPAGLNLRYWPADVAAPAPVLAQQPDPMTGQQPGGMDPLTGQPGGMDPMTGQPPADPLAQTGQVTPPTDPLAQPGFDPLAQNGQPPTDPLAQPTPASDPLAMGTTTTEPPPPPPPADPAPADPATDPATQAANNAAVAGDPAAAEADQMMTMGLAGIVLLAAGAVFFLMKKSRSRKIDLTQTTQVG